MENKYTKQQLIKSKAMSGYGDILAAVLQDKSYTLAQARAEAEKFLKTKGGRK